MTVLELTALSTERLGQVSLSLGAGMHVVLGGTGDGADELIGVAVGRVRPRRGRVRVLGRDPGRSPETRARTVAVHTVEPEPLAMTVEAVVEELFRCAGHRVGGGAALELLGLSAWAHRPAKGLSPGERRSLAATMVAAHPGPALVCVNEPLCDLPGVDLARWRAHLLALACGGACVVVTTRRPGDAALFSPEATLLEHGAVTRTVALALPELASREGMVEYVVRVGDPGAVVAALAEHGAVLAIHWDASAAPSELSVGGRDPAALSQAILEACRARGVRLQAIHPRRAGLEELHAVTAARSRLAYEAAYAAGRGGGTS